MSKSESLNFLIWDPISIKCHTCDIWCCERHRHRSDRSFRDSKSLFLKICQKTARRENIKLCQFLSRHQLAPEIRSMEQIGLSVLIHSSKLQVTQAVFPLNNWHLKCHSETNGFVNVKSNIKKKIFDKLILISIVSAHCSHFNVSRLDHNTDKDWYFKQSFQPWTTLTLFRKLSKLETCDGVTPAAMPSVRCNGKHDLRNCFRLAWFKHFK